MTLSSVEDYTALMNAWDLKYTFEDFLLLNVSNPIHAVKVLDTCKCCKRHQRCRPKELKKYIEQPTCQKREEIINCDCPCRHLSRFICRTFVD